MKIIAKERMNMNKLDFYETEKMSYKLESLPGVWEKKGTKEKYRREQGNMTPVLWNTGT